MSQAPTVPAADHAMALFAMRGPVPLVRGQGCWVWDADGRRYLDLTSAYGTTPLGHCHPRLVAAIQEQAATLISCANTFHNDRRTAFRDLLHQVLPPHLSRSYLCNSGTEAIEGGIKFAVAATGRSVVVALRQSFHGRTLGALAATWKPQFRDAFAARLGETRFVAPEDVEDLESSLDDSVAVFVAELIQGESGVLPISREFCARAQELCRERGILFMVDEIQTGIGRTGAWFAHTGLGLQPDLMALAKGLAGGFPIGAVATTAETADGVATGLHGSTFGGNPLASSAGQATLETIRDEGLIERSAERGTVFLAKLEERLADRTVVRQIRGRGLMIGIELRQKAVSYLRALEEEHAVLALPAGPNVVRFLPPLVIDEEQIEMAVDAVDAVLR